MYNNFSSKKTKKVISALLATALVATSAPISADAATVKTVGVGKTITYNAKAKVKKVTVKNKKIVTAKKSGKKVTIKGKKAGKTTVTIKTTKKTIKLTVKVGATAIAKKTVTTSMKVGETKALKVTATNGKGDTIKFTSSNKSTVKVNKASAKANSKKVAGTTVTALKAGTAKITATSKNTGKKKAFTITVVDATPTVTPSTNPAIVATTPAVTNTTTPGTNPGGSTSTTTKAPTTTSGAATNAPGSTDAANTAAPEETKAPEQTGAANTTAPEETKVPQETSDPTALTGNVAVTTNVSGASIKVLSGTSVVAEKTLEGEDLSATLENIENGTYTVQVSKAGYGTFTEVITIAGNTVSVKADIEVVALQNVKVTSETRLQLNFNGEIDEDTVKVENFKVSGVTVTSAKLTEDKKTVILETTTMTKDEKYTVSSANLTSNGVAVADAEQEFVGKEIQYELKLTLAGDKTALTSNGQDAVLVTAQLFDEEGEAVQDLDKVEIQFSTTAGSFAENKVTVQNGVATNMLTSEISTTDINALITATVVSATNKNLLNVTASKTVLMSPSVAEDAADETVGASLVDIAVETADRIVLYFNKDVDVKDYTLQDTVNGKVYTYDKSKLELKIDDNAANSATDPASNDRSVLALAPVEGNSKALVAILDVSGATANDVPLTDNAKVIVNATDKTKTVDISKSASTLVSEIRVPSILGVENDGLRKLKITFSEPVQTTAGATTMTNVTTYVADAASHWKIDGTKVDSEKWGAPGAEATVEVGEFNEETGVDNRNVVTITLGKTAAGKQIYFTSGGHSIQGDNIGDWANLTDKNNNIINTQTLDFTIAPDETVPSAKVTEESPEQYVLTFNKAVDVETVKENVVLQNYNKTSAQWEDKFTVENGGIVITAVKAEDGLASEFVVEVTKDWTYTLNTSSTLVNYYNNNYRLHIPAGKIVNEGNGLTNLEQNLLLDEEVMTAPDIKSPTIENVEQVGTTNSYTITMSEPVQIPNLLAETITASQTQSNEAANPVNAGVPRVTVTFISEDNTTTVPATIDKMVDAHDISFVATPSQTLTAGKWKVVVASISDDVGNTSSTLVVKDFEVKTVTTTVDTSFKALWVLAVPSTTVTNPITKENDSASGTGTRTDDVVYIKFNKQFKTYGAAANAVSTTNYTINGIAVPTTSNIDVSLEGYNKVANIKNGYTDLVAIHLKAGTLNSGAAESNTVNISSTIEALTGGTLSNSGLRVLNYVDPEGNSSVDNTEYYAWNYNSYTKDTDDVKADVTIKASDVQTALADGGYVDYNFNSSITGDGNGSGYTLTITDAAKTDLKITHAGNYDFTGQTFKSLTIDTTETGNITVTGLEVTGDVNVTAPNAEVTLDTVTVGGDANVKDVMNASLVLTNTSITGKLNVTDANNGSKISTTGSTAITGGLYIDTNDEVTLDVLSTIDVTVNKPAKIKVLNSAPKSLALNAAAKGVEITTEDATVSTAVNSIIANNTGETVAVKTVVSVTLDVALNPVDGYTLYSDSACGTAIGNIKTINADGVTVYAKETATGAIAKIVLKATNASTVEGTVDSITQGTADGTPEGAATTYTKENSSASLATDTGVLTVSLSD